MKPNTYHIHLNGIVQGVGMRPAIYQLATKMHLTGYVKNGNDGVNVFFNATDEEADLFFKKINAALPPKAKIVSSEMKKTTHTPLRDFSVLVEDDASQKQVLIAPDVAVCDDCRTELHDKNNRRYRYPFITCTQCGPRYSIIRELPYERHYTAMQGFTMCKSCNVEYNSVANRRFLSQTNSCHECGITLKMFTDVSTFLSDNTADVLYLIKTLLLEGKILAVKGIGGYLFLCDANNAEAIKLLRNRKRRPAKPFAILYPDAGYVQANFDLNARENALLTSPAAPIVLLYPKAHATEAINIKNIAPGLRRIGVMIPNSPLLELISHDFVKPLIATSANVSGSPIIFKDDDALDYLFGLADFVVTYNRDIIIPQDDSVVQISRHTHQSIILRRSRGYAPSFLSYKPVIKQCVLSAGAFLKSSFCLSVNGNVFVSQFLGSGEGFESQLMYKHTLKHWLNLYAVKPDVVIADMHPGYFSHQYARELAEEFGAELKLVQHHEAHFAAVLAENNLLHTKQPVLGVVWDGTGFGHDGNIWGGEFFKYEHNGMQRCCHFDYFPSVAGDQMSLQPRISALCASNNSWTKPNRLRGKFTDEEWNNYQALISKANLFTSSAGRIFDAVASLLNICDKQTYEGEAAQYLQALAEEYVDANGFLMDDSYFNGESPGHLFSAGNLMDGIISDIESGEQTGYIAAKFHYSMVCLVDIVATNLNIASICFSGGVFQNSVLVDWIMYALGNKYSLYFSKNLSPNDEQVSFGQLVHYENGITCAPITAAVKLNQLLAY